MKFKLFTVFFLVLGLSLTLAVHTTARPRAPVTYYVSSSTGDNENDGDKENEPIQTISKVNELTLYPGDAVLFKCGDTWQAEQLVISQSGDENESITFGSYPSDCEDKPVLSGSLPISGWSVHNSDIYMAAVPESTFPLGINQLFRNGERLTLGRWPNLNESNGGYSFVDAHTSGSSQITDNELPNGIDWRDATIHIKNIRWSMLTRQVTGFSGKTLTLNAGFSCLVSGWGTCAGWGYFINNHLATLDQDGEWYYDANNHIVYLYSANGIPTNIEGSIILEELEDEDDVFRHGGLMLSDGSATSYVVIDNLEIKNWFNHGIGTPGGMRNDIYHHITVQNVTIKDVNASGARLSSWLQRPSDGRLGLRGGHHLTFENNIIDGANAFGITGYFAESTFEGNIIRNIALIKNLGKSGMSCSIKSTECTENGDGLRIRMYRYEDSNVLDSGFGNTLRYNHFEKTGYNGLDVFGPDTLIENNFFTLTCYSKADCGAVRVYSRTTLANVRLLNNVIVNIPGNVDGCEASRKAFGMGLYIDSYSHDVEIRGNTIISTTITGINFKFSSGQIIDNTVYNASTGEEFSAHISLGSDPTSATISGNKLFGLNHEAWTIYARSLDSFISSDNNYLFHPYVEKHIAFGPSWTRYSFTDWKTFSGLEANSKTNWYTQVEGEEPLSQILYNETQNPKTFDLGTRKYLDLDQNDVSSPVTLQPFTSLILVDNGEAGLQLLSMTPSTIGLNESRTFTLTLKGTGFTPNSIVRWDGNDRPTNFISSSTLTATIYANDVDTIANIPVTVYDPDGDPNQTPPLTFHVVALLQKIYLPQIIQ